MPRKRRIRDSARGSAIILDAARELVLERGPDEVSLREIASRAHFSPAGLYEYFESKEAILGALGREVSGRLRARMASVPDTLPPPRRLVRLAQAYLTFARESPQDYLLLFGRLRSKRNSGQEPIEPSSPFALVFAAVLDGIAAGELHTEEGFGADEISYSLWALVHGMAMLQATHLATYKADFEEVDRRAVEKFIAGLRGRAR